MLLQLTILILKLTRVTESTRCFECEGFHCSASEFCTGDYCWASSYVPRMGPLSLDSIKFLKGCVSGSLPSELLNNCALYPTHNAHTVKSCLCNSSNCNANVMKLKHLEKKLIECQCDGTSENCKANLCSGEMCTTITSLKTGQVSHGCLDASLPLIEGLMVDTCVTPAFVGGLQQNPFNRQSEDFEMCLCDKPFCNRSPPKLRSFKRFRCPVEMSALVNGIHIDKDSSTCWGHKCFEVELSSEKLENSVKGCVSFANEKAASQASGCVEFESLDLEGKLCFNQQKKKEKFIKDMTASDESSQIDSKKGQPEMVPVETDMPKTHIEPAAPASASVAEAPKLLEVHHNPSSLEFGRKVLGESTKHVMPVESGGLASGDVAIIAIASVIVVVLVAVGLAIKNQWPRRFFVGENYESVN